MCPNLITAYNYTIFILAEVMGYKCENPLLAGFRFPLFGEFTFSDPYREAKCIVAQIP